MVTILAGSFYIATKPKDVTSLPVIPVVHTSTTTDKSTWHTYTNTKQGYSIRYPADWVITPEKSFIDGVNNIPSLVYISDKNKQHSIYIEVNRKEWLLKNEALIHQKMSINSVEHTVYIFPNGYECYDSKPGDDCSFIQVPIKHGSVWYNLGAIKDAKKYEGIYADIFSTFRFSR